MRPTKLFLPPAEIRRPVLGHRQVLVQRALVDLDSAGMGAAEVDVEEKGEANGWKKNAKVLEECRLQVREAPIPGSLDHREDIF